MAAMAVNGNRATQLVEGLIRKHYQKPGDIVIIGVTGQAGAGKTTMARVAQKATLALGLSCNTLSLDAFFKLSRRGRKAWLEEPGISSKERARRENQVSWWDFDWAASSLATLKANKPLELRNVYSRHDDGEQVGKITIKPHEAGGVILFDGVAILHVSPVDEYLYLHALPEVRFNRLLARDGASRNGDAALQRWRLTQSFERNYFREHWGKITSFLDNSTEDPVPLEALAPEDALRPHSQVDI